MSTNFQFLNSLIPLNDKTDDLLEEKIRENEATLQALENSNDSEKSSNLFQKQENQEKLLETIEINNNNNDDNINNLQKQLIKEEIIYYNQINKPTITPSKAQKLNENNNSSSSTNINNNTSNIAIINISNNLSNRMNSNNDNKISFNKDDKDFLNIGDHSSNYHYQNKDKIRNNKNKISTFNMHNNFTNLKENLDSFQNIETSEYYQYYQNMLYLSNEKEKRMNKSVEKRQLYRNIINKNKKKSHSIIKDKNEERFSNAYKRFLDNDKKKKEKLEKMKKIRDEQEKKKYLFHPKINKKSKKLVSKRKEDFYTRQNKLIEVKKKKMVFLKEKNGQNNIQLFSSNLFGKDTNKKNRKKSVDEAINKLYDWEAKRKEKINNKRKNKEKDMENNTKNIPTINKKSYSIKVNLNNNQIIDRLYKADIEKRKENKEILTKVYTPSFQPLISKNKSPSKINSKNKSVKNKENTNNYINDLNNNETRFKFLCNKYLESINNEDSHYSNVDKLIREKLFSKIKNKVKYKSVFRLKEIITNNSTYNNNDPKYYGENIEDKSFVKNTSSSFVK